MSNFESKSKAMSKNDELKKLRERIEELEFVKTFNKTLLLILNILQEHLSKVFARSISKEIEKKTKPFKTKWLYQCFGISNKLIIKELNMILSRTTKQSCSRFSAQNQNQNA
jgi:hypothetical protein